MMAVWRQAPQLRFYPGVQDWFIVADDWSVRLDNFSLHVPEGFIHDGPSIPWIAQLLTPMSGLGRVAALVHDALYSIQGDGRITRKQTDQLFHDLLGPGTRSRLMYWGVRMGGGAAWRDESECDVLNLQQGSVPTVKLI